MTNTCVYADNASKQLYVPYVKRYMSENMKQKKEEEERDPAGPALPATLRNALIGLDRN